MPFSAEGSRVARANARGQIPVSCRSFPKPTLKARRVGPLRQSWSPSVVAWAASDGIEVVCLGEALFVLQQPCLVEARKLSVKNGCVKAVERGRQRTLTDCIADQKGRAREEVESWTPYPGGAPANVVCGLSKLGVKTMFLSALGTDEFGNQLMQLLEDCGVVTESVQRVEKPTRDVLVVRDEDGEREFSGFGRATEEYCDCFIESSQLPESAIQGAAVLVTGTLGLAYPVTAAAMRRAVALAKQGGAKVMVDVNWRPVFWGDPGAARSIVNDFLQSADIIKISDDETDWLLGIAGNDALCAPAKVKAAFPRAQGVLVTAGSEGASFCFDSPGGKGNLSGFQPVFEVAVEETTGAGDAFTSGFLYKMISAGGLEQLLATEGKGGLIEAVRYAAACGALTATGPGAIAAQPSHQQIQKLLS